MKVEGLISQLCFQACIEKGRCSAPKTRAPSNPSLLKAHSSLLRINNFLQVVRRRFESCESSCQIRNDVNGWGDCPGEETSLKKQAV